MGINPFENDQVNICYVVDSKYFKKHGQDPEAVFKGWVKNSPHLQQVMVASSRITPWKAVKIPVRDSVVHYEKGIWRAGNSAAFIDTATGGGITVALQSGQILAKALASNANDEDILRVYDSEYRRHFSGQRRLAALFGSMIHYPWAADTIIRLLDLNNKMGQSVMNYSRPGFQLARGFK